MGVIISSEDTRSLCPCDLVLQAQSRGFVTLLLLFGSAAPQPSRVANIPISSVSGRRPTLSATRVTRGPTGSLAWQQFQCRSCSFQQWSPCVSGSVLQADVSTAPQTLPFAMGGPQTRFFLPPFLEETAQKACPRFTRPGERHCWVFDQSGNRPGSDWWLENFKCGPLLLCVLIVKIFLLPFLCCVGGLPGCVISPS